MFTLTYILRTPGADPTLVAVTTPSREAAFLTWWALRSGGFVANPRLWRGSAMVA
jgi:hypothetical protein